MNCADCKYAHDVGFALLCWGQKNAPRVDAESWCDGWKPKADEKPKWTFTKDGGIPAAWESVQVWIPSQDPFPVVREGYIVDDESGIPLYWFVPALRERFMIDAIEAWIPMATPPRRN